jgi:hypothetical protein
MKLKLIRYRVRFGESVLSIKQKFDTRIKQPYRYKKRPTPSNRENAAVRVHKQSIAPGVTDAGYSLSRSAMTFSMPLTTSVNRS